MERVHPLARQADDEIDMQMHIVKAHDPLDMRLDIRPVIDP